MALPVGPAVTFLFSDVEGSTRHAHRLGDDGWAALLARHDDLVDSAVARFGGVVVKHEGDGAFAAFERPEDAVAAALAILGGTVDGSLGEHGQGVRIRCGLHTGEGRLTSSGLDYVGIDVNYAARVSAAGNGGQLVISETTRAGLHGGADAADPALPAELEIVDEGPRKLKDFDDPRPIYRVVVAGVTDDARPLRTEDLPTNLPSLPTRFVGRGSEVALLADLLARDRLLTLTGPGGTGKTRLGVGLAESVRGRFRGGTWFVDLAPVRDPGLIVGSIATVLGLTEEPGVPIATTLRERLRPLEILVLLDNLEQLLPDAAGVVAGLLRDAPGLRLIVTSREVLRIAGEQEYLVPPLGDAEGVELFLDRARARRGGAGLTEGDSAIARQIVDRLEGLPLAIELAAARTRLMSPTAVLERLSQSLDLLVDGARDLPERQRTLRGTIAWSHDMLGQEEQVIFRRLGVFDGDWTAEAAAAVVDPQRALELDVLAGMESMIDKSLVRLAITEHGEPRFGRHMLIREYSLERLIDAGERPDCQRRHALTYLELAERAGPRLLGEEADRWLDVVEHEEHNLRTAMRWSLDEGEPGIGMRIVGAIWRYWQRRSRLGEGSAWAAELLAHPGLVEPRERIAALAAAGGMAYWNSDLGACRSYYEERLDLATALGDPAILAEAHYDFGFVGLVERDAEMLRHHEEAAVALFESVGDQAGVVRARQSLVLVRVFSGDFEGARELELRNLAEFRRTGATYRVQDSLTLLAVSSIFAGDMDAGRTYLLESRRLTSGEISDQMAGLSIAAHLALRSSDPEAGARLAGAAAAVRDETGLTNAALDILHLADPMDVAREQLGPLADALIDEGRAMSLDDALTLALSVVGRGDAAS